VKGDTKGGKRKHLPACSSCTIYARNGRREKDGRVMDQVDGLGSN